MSRYKEYKRKLRWKGSIRKTGAPDDRDLQVNQLQQMYDTPSTQNPEDPYLEARHGPWRGVWRGGRLMDVFHDESETPLEALQVGDYDWQRGGLVNQPSTESLTQKLQEWAQDHGGETERNMLPYQ